MKGRILEQYTTMWYIVSMYRRNMLKMHKTVKIVVLVLVCLLAGPVNTTFAAKRMLKDACHGAAPMASHMAMDCCAGQTEMAPCSEPANHGSRGLCCMGIDCFGTVPGDSNVLVNTMQFSALGSYPLLVEFANLQLILEDDSIFLHSHWIPDDIYIRHCVFLI